MKKKIHVFMIVITTTAVLFSLPTGCSSRKQSQTERTQTVIDGAGREIIVPAEVNRVISLVSGITGMLYEIGAGDKVIGVTKSMPYPTTYAYSQTDVHPDVGSIANINVEQVIALDPDLVFTTEFFLNAAGVLEERGIHVVAIRLDTLSDLLWNIRFIGSLVGNKKEADKLAESMGKTIADIKLKTQNLKNENKPVVYIENGSGSSYGATSWCTESILAAGGINIYGSSAVKMPRPNFEYVIKKNPDVILAFVLPCKTTEDFYEQAESVISDFKSRPGWDAIDAVRNSRFCIMENRCADFGPHQIDSVIAMAKIFHKGLFTDLPKPEYSYYGKAGKTARQGVTQ